MPVFLSRPTRRQFLQASAVGAVTVLWHRTGLAQYGFNDANPNRLAILSDTHIDRRPEREVRDANMTDNMIMAVREATGLEPSAAAMLVCGDCVIRPANGMDYAQLGKIIEPVHAANLPIHLMMGNHDNRDMALNAFTKQQADPPRVEGKLVHVLQTPRATWILLDSLHDLNTTPGKLGETQLAWLAQFLDQLADEQGDDTNVIIACHHNPPFDEEGKTLALLDSDALLEVLVPRPIVKAMLFGHTHRYYKEERDGLHLCGLPAVAYVFNAKEPIGWTVADVMDNALSLQLRCLDMRHPMHENTRICGFRRA